MAGIKVPRYGIFKLGTKKLKYSNWNLNISKSEAEQRNEFVYLFEGQVFRIISKILDTPTNEIDYSKYILSVLVENSQHFNRVVDEAGITINGITYKRFLGTSGGLKCNTILLVNEDILNELNERCECGRNTSLPIVPAKLEAYKALTCSASQPINPPKDILVVSDAMVHIKNQTVEFLDDTKTDTPVLTHLEDYETDNNATDGYSICTIEYMEKISKESLELDYVTHGVCLRNAWFKGMMFPFPIKEFVEEYCPDNWIVQDIWGNDHDLREVELITTESSLKLWNSYTSIDDYLQQVEKNGYEFAVTKIISPEVDKTRELNYQYLQSYDFTDEDIKELCKPTVDYLKQVLCGDYQSVIKFLGIASNVREEDRNNWQHALQIDKNLIGDPYIIDSVNKMIKHKINRAKIGKLIVEGNYLVCSGDPIIFIQHVCGLEKTGLLKPNECYSKYWLDKDEGRQLVVFRSPMLVHNNVCKLDLHESDAAYKWYQYMDTCIIINGYDTTFQSLSGADADGDIFFCTKDKILLSKYRDEPAIVCQQKNADKVIPTLQDMIKVERNGMGNKVGSITNRITAMLERIVFFEKGTKEYEELRYRCLCGQLYQQNEIDKLKGIISNSMPGSWYNYRACKGDDFLKSICAEKKPYFMTYIYDDYRDRYKSYEEEANYTSINKTGKTIKEIKNTEHRSNKEQEVYDDYIRWHPFGMNPCIMNRICWYIEDEFKGIVSKLKKQYKFDYRYLMYGVSINKKRQKELLSLAKQYHSDINKLKKKRLSTDTDSDNKKEQNIISKEKLKTKCRELAKEICPNDKERMDAIIELAYTDQCNKQFCWECVGDLIINRLEEINHERDNI